MAMRKITLLFLGSVFCIQLTAQVFNAGVGGGLSISQVDGDGFSGYNKAGATLGLFVNTFLSDSWAWQMEIRYSSKGSARPTTIEDPRYYRMGLRYIEIPLLARYFLSDGIMFEAGLSGGYLFNSKEEDELGEMVNTVPFKKGELAAIMGIGYPITEKLLANARISYSVIPIREHAGGGTFYFNRGQNNNVISFMLQYQF